MERRPILHLPLAYLSAVTPAHRVAIWGGWLFGLLLQVSLALPVKAEVPRVLPPGELPADRRLGPLKTLDDYFPFTPASTPEAWTRRAERVRRQMLVALGLWPMPERTPPHAVIHGRVDRPEYTVEKVYLESFPGHFVTGNLYRPKNAAGKRPGVLCPHGHWANGRFYDAGPENLKRELKTGGEKLDPCGRYPLQARCVQLARMGCVVFHYDMVGYADSVQLAHRPGLREHMNTQENWGYFSPQAELRLQHMMGLQTYNSIRVLDWFCELPEVDSARIGVTGASGGGTQTFILCAIDDRPKVAFPAVMISTAMQGGCTCENACYLRVDTGNVEFAALFAPRALGMTAADDWTREMPTKGFPELQAHYRMLGCEDHVMLAPLLQFPHNYNYPSRLVMYRWMNRHLGLGIPEPIDEQPFEPLTVAEMSVWDDDHPKPPSGEDYERSLLRWITADTNRQMESLLPHDPTSLAKYRQILGGALEVMIGRGLPSPWELEFDEKIDRREDGYRLLGGLLRYPAKGEEIPVVALVPEETPWNGRVVIWVTEQGKQGLFQEDGRPIAGVRQLLAKGFAVAGLDLFGQGEFTPDGKPMDKNRLDPKRPNYAGYTYGYNHPLFSQRIHDILVAIAAARSLPEVEAVYLLGLRGAAHWVAAARAQAGSAVARAAIDTGGFRFAQLNSFDHADFLPGAVKYLDLPGLLSLSAPHELFVAGEPHLMDSPVAKAYASAGALANLSQCKENAPEKIEEAAIDWLTR